MKINIFGSTGIIGEKSLKLAKSYFPNIKINLLVVNSNINKLIKQCEYYKPKYICIKKTILINKIKNKISKKIKIIHHDNLFNFLKSNKSDLSILAISGYNALDYFEPIVNNTKFLGLVNKEIIVSSGHLFKKKKYLNKTIIFPIDSEHFSLFYYFKNRKFDISKIKKIYLTASGGPFLNYKKSQLSNVTYKDAINHPKWKMGYKNSIDSATLANKCLELIEAHYLFNIPYNKLDIKIHPQSLIHSIIEYNDGFSMFNYFYNDMDIPILNFYNFSQKNSSFNVPKKFSLSKKLDLNFDIPDKEIFPIYKTFQKIANQGIEKKIMFNVINEYAVNLFKKRKIKFNDISHFVDKYISLDLKFKLTNIKNIIDFQSNVKNRLDNENIF